MRQFQDAIVAIQKPPEMISVVGVCYGDGREGIQGGAKFSIGEQEECCQNRDCVGAC